MNQIPRILHTGCFGGYQLSDLNKRCIESWHKVLPDYKVMNWTDENGPQDPFFQQAIKVKPVNASNFIKFWALYHHGGVFLDFDVEVLKPFDLTQGCFLGFQRDDTRQDCINGAVMGAVKDHWFIGDCLRKFDSMAPDVWPVFAGCTLLTDELYAIGMEGLNVEQMVGDIKVYDKQAFYPWRHDEKPDLTRVTEKTFAIHWCEGSWTK